jgi:hypothetical protein
MSFHKTESCFRRYENIITECLLKWPTPVRFKTLRSPTTDAARCRDAIGAFRVSNWTPASEHELYAKLKTGEIKPTTWIVDDWIYVGMKPRHGDDVITPDDDSATYRARADQFGAINFTPSSPDHIKIILTLIEETVIDFPVAVPISWKDTAEQLAKELLNVALRPDEATNKLYIL